MYPVQNHYLSAPVQCTGIKYIGTGIKYIGTGIKYIGTGIKYIFIFVHWYYVFLLFCFFIHCIVLYLYLIPWYLYAPIFGDHNKEINNIYFNLYKFHSFPHCKMYL